MAVKAINFKIQGMQRDLSASAFNPKFAYENMNMRLTPDKENTLLSLTNEKGTKDTGVQLLGIPLGMAIIIDTAVIFTRYESMDKDYIYKVNIDSNNNVKPEVIYCGSLGFNIKYPIDTLVYYESEKVQKVYWTDSINPLRFINVANGDISNTAKLDFTENIEEGINLDVTITREENINGLFPSGIIQYFITYYNKYGQESGIVYQSPLYYMSPSDRGGTSEETNKVAFKITINGYDTSWDYLRVYSIHRTSISSEVAGYIVDEFRLNKGVDLEISFYDFGKNEAIGSTDILYKSRSPLIVGALTQKFSTLFIGNITTKTFEIDENLETSIRESFIVEEKGYISHNYPEASGYYPYLNLLSKSSSEVKHFKGQEYYRFGIQLMDKYGVWSNPIYLNDLQIENYPYQDNGKIHLPSIHLKIVNENIKSILIDNGFIAVRALEANPINNRSIAAQGVLCPTVYNIDDRVNNNIYGTSSWFFRGFPANNNFAVPQSVHNAELYTPNYRAGEIQSASSCKSTYSIDFSNESGILYRAEIWVYQYPYTGTRNWRGQILEAVDNNVVNTPDGQPCNLMALPDNFLGDGKRAGEYVMNFNIARQALAKLANELMYGLGNQVFRITEEQWENHTIVNLLKDNDTSYVITTDSLKKQATNNKYNYFVDQNLITFHSPDISVDAIDGESNNYNVRIIGIVPVTSVVTDYDIQYNGGLYNPDREGVIDRYFSVPNLSRYSIGLVSAGLFDDDSSADSPFNTLSNSYFVIYPWQKTGSLSASSTQKDGEVTKYATLNTKVIANSKYSYATLYFNNSDIPNYELEDDLDVYTFNSNELTVINIKDEEGDGYLSYYGNIDKLLSPKVDIEDNNNVGYPIYYEIVSGNDTEDRWKNIKYDELIDNNSNVITGTEPTSIKYKSTPHAVFKLKESTILPALNVINPINILYNGTGTSGIYLGLKQSEIPSYDLIVKGIKDDFTGFSPDDTGSYYYIDGYVYYIDSVDSSGKATVTQRDPKSGEVFLIGDNMVMYMADDGSFARDTIYTYNQELINCDFSSWKGSEGFPYMMLSNSSNILYLAELYTPYNTTEEACTAIYGDIKNTYIKSNTSWTPSSKIIPLKSLSSNSLINLTGDTYFSRWDCLKTYPFTTEDENQIVEILSFMVESNVNLDGRTDRNRGSMTNINMTPTNFNLYNDIYNQKDNYFQYRYIENNNDELSYTVAWSFRKSAMDIIDNWTSISQLNSIDLDSSYGGITRLDTIGNDLLFFQQSAVGKLLYNESAQISTSAGVPVELGNTGTVSTYRYLATSVGLPDKWAYCKAKDSAYFIDPYSSGIYRLSDSLTNLSDNLGYRTWINTHSSEITGWNPNDFTGYVLYYDKANSEVYIIGKNDCMVYSELLQQFISFYSYEDTPYFFNLRNRGFFLRKDGKLWEQHEGDYNSFFGELKPYYVTIIANPDSTKDKIFNNIEFRSDVIVDGKADNTPPFDKLTVWNEYQNGTSGLSFSMNRISNLKKKFRIWRALIPRDDSNHRDRIRNPWAYIKLSKGEEKGTQNKDKIILHDITVQYFD